MTDIPKNRLSKSHISVAQNASGRSLNVPIYRISDNAPGPRVYIQSSIHGAEVQGNVVIYHLLQALSSQKINGEIILVPNCNPVGTNIKAGEYTLGRFDPVNGTNWNRGYHYDEEQVFSFADSVQENDTQEQIKQAFRQSIAKAIDNKLSQPWGLGLAQQLNLRLQQIATTADIVLDLHNGPVSTRHIYIPEYAKSAAYEFSIPHCIFIPNKFAGALDEATFCPWWTLQETLQARFSREFDFGVQAFTLEMGSQEVIQFDEGEKDAVSILGYLSQKGMLQSGDYKPASMRRIGVMLKDYRTMFTDFGGMVEYCVAPGQHVKAGDTMARILNIDDLDNHKAVQNVVAPCDLIPILHFPSASVLSGTQLYKCFTEYFEL
ncbi:succinylglutamate desuccinylase/aspartoacylase family protein [Glaciecola sp. XM2]|jgi:predicted deacylase|uniref:succinylglutamate desuccinylase/aspartoacylase domain-containing protein n=1 Tax=Glaciecola sp. XM2 TaxID=1914931 RepID=UPI001BDDD36E|nr:succinylglutamate desuccinylase/aspartoacylase family protein [Glaciecola sp. XM2]MBT1451798.1 succinylglutamate desuccinylase/aspartoacylase family protein [Glaciecola sp. XM2]